MPCLTQLARFSDGGCVIATIVVRGVCRRRCCHFLHMRTVFTSQLYACTRLQGHSNAQEGEYQDKNSSHFSSLARRPRYVTRFLDISTRCALLRYAK